MSMASIFTWESDTPRVSSPWLQGADSPPLPGDDEQIEPPVQLSDAARIIREGASGTKKVTRLQAEPQDGPVEYKLHLLLRARRKFRSTSTGSHVSGSRHARYGGVPAKHKIAPEFLFDSASSSGNSTPSQASMHQARQHRLQQLTTQLLWRLQQSSPHHTSSATNFILPSLPEALPELQAPLQPARLLHGLEESQGALYEIGVSDDGTLVGLAEDEMLESLNNLRAMAACLGCSVEVLRKETVGDCEWVEDTNIAGKDRKVRRTGKLVVAEALVKPHLHSVSPSMSAQESSKLDTFLSALPSSAESTPPATQQLRVTLLGPTMSGKSSLLGTLTTSTLDNGRGKSRLSMLRHRHEITSGVTSSVTQELLGYQDNDMGGIDVINYATENTASWIDIHAASAGSRMVLISDSAGHPRYRRTTMKGLVGWAPHWTLLCIPADTSDDKAVVSSSTSSPQQLPVPSDLNLSGAQLDLCLRLGMPLIVVMTKLDSASRTGLRASLTKVLDALKAAGRQPAIMANQSGTVAEEDLQVIRSESLELAYSTALPLLNDPRGTVPIVLTSAVEGSGISNLHALLHELPIAEISREVPDAEPLAIFDVEDIYSKPAEIQGVIVSGRLRRGQISVGDELFIGPFSSGHEHYEDSEDSDERPFRRTSSALPTSRSFPGALRASHFAPPSHQLPNQEWRKVRVTSIRNLRLPVHTLHAEQVGTMAISMVGSDASASSLSRAKKGMVLTPMQPMATRTFEARFEREDLEHLTVGSHVVVYIYSVRASARVVSARAPDSSEFEKTTDQGSSHDVESHDPFGFGEFEPTRDGQSNVKVTSAITATEVLVTLSLDVSKEFIMVGDRVLVMPSSGPLLYAGHERGEKGIAGLDGFIGEVTLVRG